MLAVQVLAAGGGTPSAMWQILGPVIVAALALPGAIYTARVTLRAANSGNAVAQVRNDNDRDAAIDARADQAVATLWARLDAQDTRLHQVIDERNLLAEKYARLRLFVIGLGVDPDQLPPHAPAPAGAT